jgi:Flp pilus assembly protein TadB
MNESALIVPLLQVCLLAVFAVLAVALWRRSERSAKALETTEQAQRDQDERAYVAARSSWDRSRQVPEHPLQSTKTPERLARHPLDHRMARNARAGMDVMIEEFNHRAGSPAGEPIASYSPGRQILRPSVPMDHITGRPIQEGKP